MCGIYGCLGETSMQEVSDISDILYHRGPDDCGLCTADIENQSVSHYRFSDSMPGLEHMNVIDKSCRISRRTLVLGHRRLSIVDLSVKGHQPMQFDDHIIIFNGEIYNYIELRRELEKEGVKFQTQSDTEVLVRSYIAYGPKCLEKFNGMWSFAIYDIKGKKLFISRDRFGVKPLYFYNDGSNFAFASEIKALFKFGFVRKNPSIKEAQRYLIYGLNEYRNETCFENIYRLLPGHSIVFDLGSHSMRTEKYYEIPQGAEYEDFSESKAKEYSEKFLEILTDAVKIRLRSDVRVGSCFSGGLDSSAIVYLINGLLKSEKVQSIGDMQYTFSNVYKKNKEYGKYDESSWIELGEKETHARNFTVETSAQHIKDLSSKVAFHQDEPFDTTSIFAQWNVMDLPGKSGITVTLDGQGADESWAGYLTYIAIASLEQKKFGSTKRISNFNSRNLLKVLGAKLLGKRGTAYFLSASRTAKVFSGIKPVEYIGSSKFSISDLNSRLKCDMMEYLSNLLRYADRNAMAHSIESRFPFLDYRLVEFAFSVPSVYKIHDGWTKYIERTALDGIVNKDIVWRRDKLGFVTPESIWFEKELYGWGIEKVQKSRLLKEMSVKKNLYENDPKHRWKLVNLAEWESVFNL